MNNSPIHIVSTFHYDVLYLKDYDAYLAQGLDIIGRALELLEAEPEYRFTVEQVILVREYFNRFPECRDTMRRLAQSGRLCFAPGMFVMPDMNMGGDESLYRQIRLGKEWLREHLGVEPEACWIADCWGHHAQLPQMLRQCGYTSYFFWRGMRREVSRSDFLWRGLDGTQITAHWLTRGYSGVHFPDKDANVDNRLEQKIVVASATEIDLLAAELRRYGDHGATLVCNGGDFCIPQRNAPATLRELNRRAATAGTLRFSTPPEYSAALNAGTLDTVGGEFNAMFQGSYSTNIRIKQQLRKHTTRLLAQEAYLAILGQSAAPLAPAWETVLKHQFHDTVCGTVTDAALHRVQRDFAGLDAAIPAGDALFNPTGHARRETVELPGGNRVHAELAPFEARAFDAFPAAEPLRRATAAEAEFANAFYRIRFDARGFPSSLLTPSGTELIDATSPAPFGGVTMQNDNGDSWLTFEGPVDGGSREAAFASNASDPLEREAAGDHPVNRKTFYPAVDSVECFRSADTLRVIQHGTLAFWRNRIAFTAQAECAADSPLIRWRVAIEPAGRHYRLRAAFPTTIRRGTVTHEIPFGLQRRGHSEYPAQGFCDWAGNNAGVTLFNRGIPGNNVDENGVLLLTLFRSAAMEYKCESAASFNEGVPHTFEYALMARDGESLLPVMLPAEQYARPLCEVHAGTSRFDFTGWRLPANVRISALRPHPGGVFVRLYEALGETGGFTLPPPAGIAARQETDGLERPAGPVHPFRAPLPLRLDPFEIRNLLLIPEQ